MEVHVIKNNHRYHLRWLRNHHRYLHPVPEEKYEIRYQIPTGLLE